MTDQDGRVREIVASRVSQLVEGHGEKQDFSSRAGIPLSTLNRIIRGENDTSLPTLIRIATLTKVSLDWLAGIGGDAEVPEKSSPDVQTAQMRRAMMINGKLSRVAVDRLATRLGIVRPSGQNDPDGEIISGDNLDQNAGDADAGGFLKIPVLKVIPSAGLGRVALNEDENKDVIPFREDWLRDAGLVPGRTEAMIISGDSMRPTLHDGDVILVDRREEPVVSGKVYVLVANGDVRVKRLFKRVDGSLLLKSDNDGWPDEFVTETEVDRLIIEGRVRWCGHRL